MTGKREGSRAPKRPPDWRLLTRITAIVVVGFGSFPLIDWAFGVSIVVGLAVAGATLCAALVLMRGL